MRPKVEGAISSRRHSSRYDQKVRSDDVANVCEKCDLNSCIEFMGVISRLVCHRWQELGLDHYMKVSRKKCLNGGSK